MKSRLGNILAVQMTNIKQTQQASAYHTVTTEKQELLYSRYTKVTLKQRAFL